MRPTGSLIPGGCTWYKTSVAEFNPEKNLVLTTNGDEVTDPFPFAYCMNCFNLLFPRLVITCKHYSNCKLKFYLTLSAYSTYPLIRTCLA